MPDLRQKTSGIAWVTGAGRGIGRAVALQLACEGWCVAASARTERDLNALSAAAAPLAGEIIPFVVDISDELAPADAFALIERTLGPVDLVILNAGTYEPVDGAAFEARIVRHLVDTNLMGTVDCLEPVMHRFVERGRGRIAVVASLAGYRGLPSASGYGATKAALINMCEALRPELSAKGVILSIITPGFVRTPLTDRNKFPMPFLIDAETAADKIVRGLEKDRFEITFPRPFSYLMKFVRILPYWAFFALSRRLRPGEKS